MRCGVESSPALRGLAQLKAGQWDFHCPACAEPLTPVPTTEEEPSEINSVYALSKRHQEELCLIYVPQVTYEQGFRELGEWVSRQSAEDKTEPMLKELSTHGLTA